MKDFLIDDFENKSISVSTSVKTLVATVPEPPIIAFFGVR